ncbi:MAG: hypothetical protein ACYC3S_02400 [Chloroflexota bacterium]
MSARLGKFLALLLVVATLSSGCQGAAVVPVSPNPVVDSAAGGADAVGGPRHDLAVISLDFDPPLRVLQVDTFPTKMALLVVVDNKGTYTERDVTVTAELRSQAEDELLARTRQSLSSIAPGQATLVRLGGFPSIPTRSGYVLVVVVEGATGDAVPGNNTKTVPLQLVLSN